MYKALADKYGYTCKEIASMSPQLQALMLKGPSTKTFGTQSEYRAWKNQR